MRKVFIVSGPPGVGKSTISLELSKKLNKSAYIDGDLLYHQVINEYAAPWDENNHLNVQYKIILEISSL